MDKVNGIRTGRHCISALYVDLVFLTVYQQNVLTKPMNETLKKQFSKVCTDFDAELISFRGDDSYVCLRVRYPAKVAVSSLVNSLKGASSRVLKHQHPEVVSRLHKGALWSPSYFAGSISDGDGFEKTRYLSTHVKNHFNED